MVPAQSDPDGVADILARYAEIVDDPNALLAIAKQPLPVCIWNNPLKSNPKTLLAYLAALGVELTPIDWMPGAFQATQWTSPGSTLAFTAGWYYVQEEIAMVAVAALDPQPGEVILDMCAAPGGKTAQIAIRLRGTGTVIANEMHAARFPSLSTTVNRLGLTQVITTQADGRSLPSSSRTFDRVLVDAPCSGEGNFRRRQRPRPWHSNHGLRIAAAQKKLLSRALDLVKPGGIVVYSTCTFAPEENEAVLDAVIGDRAIVIPFDIPQLRGQPGLTRWQGQSYRTDVGYARRYFPHFNNTGGFFVAKLRRTETRPAPTVVDFCPLSPVRLVAGNPLKTLSEQFGLQSERLAHYRCWATGKRRLWLLNEDCVPWLGVLPQTFGIALATHTNLGLKPTTAFLQQFGPHLTRNIVNLPDQQAAITFLQGRSQPLQEIIPRGYVHVRFQTFDLGCGRLTQERLESQIPKTLRW